MVSVSHRCSVKETATVNPCTTCSLNAVEETLRCDTIYDVGVAKTMLLENPCFCHLPKTGIFGENGENDAAVAFYLRNKHLAHQTP